MTNCIQLCTVSALVPVAGRCRHMDFRLSSDQKDLRGAARDFARAEFGPRASDWDQQATLLPDDSRRHLGKLGYLGLTLPEAYGGSQAPLLDGLLVLEEFA